MWYSKTKIGAARIAAQAIALAVRDAGGDVVGVLFVDTWLIGANWGDALLFAPAAWPTEGGTYFAFLSDLWRRYPSHWVVLVTDGDGYVPYASAPDRARTGAVVIPDGKPEKMAEIPAGAGLTLQLGDRAQRPTRPALGDTCTCAAAQPQVQVWRCSSLGQSSPGSRRAYVPAARPDLHIRPEAQLRLGLFSWAGISRIRRCGSGGGGGS